MELGYSYRKGVDTTTTKISCFAIKYYTLQTEIQNFPDNFTTFSRLSPH